jgi:ABC-type amino acid transport system permease subunit
MSLKKFPKPPPSIVFVSATVGEFPVLQQTPFDIIFPDLLKTIVPPLVAVVPVILVTAAVVTVGTFSLLQLNNKVARVNMITPEIPDTFFMLVFINLIFLKYAFYTSYTLFKQNAT